MVDLVALPLLEKLRGEPRSSVVAWCCPHILGAPTPRCFAAISYGRDSPFTTRRSHTPIPTPPTMSSLGRISVTSIRCSRTVGSATAGLRSLGMRTAGGRNRCAFLMRHGPRILSEGELRRRLRFELDHYCRFRDTATSTAAPTRHAFPHVSLPAARIHRGRGGSTSRRPRVVRILRALVQDAGAEPEDPRRVLLAWPPSRSSWCSDTTGPPTRNDWPRCSPLPAFVCSLNPASHRTCPSSCSRAMCSCCRRSDAGRRVRLACVKAHGSGCVHLVRRAMACLDMDACTTWRRRSFTIGGRHRGRSTTCRCLRGSRAFLASLRARGLERWSNTPRASSRGTQRGKRACEGLSRRRPGPDEFPAWRWVGRPLGLPWREGLRACLRCEQSTRDLRDASTAGLSSADAADSARGCV